MHDELTNIQLDRAIAQLPGYYAESPMGQELIRLLCQAIPSMRLQGHSEAEINIMFKQALKELRLGLDAMPYSHTMIH